MKGLDRNAPSVPPQNSPQESQQVDMWKKYIQWEKSNPLRTEDQTLITKRGDLSLLGCVVLAVKIPAVYALGPVIPVITQLYNFNNVLSISQWRYIYV